MADKKSKKIYSGIEVYNDTHSLGVTGVTHQIKVIDPTSGQFVGIQVDANGWKIEPGGGNASEQMINIGTGTKTTPNSSNIAIGYNADASDPGLAGQGLGGVAIGNQAKAYGDSSFALGTLAEATKWGGIAIGWSSSVTSSFSQSFGIGLGYNSEVTNIDGIAIGRNTLASGNGSIVIGHENISSTPLTNSTTNSLGIGWDNTTGLEFLLAGGTTDSYLTSGANGQVGFGLTSPTAKVHIRGAGSTSSTDAFIVQNSSSSTLLHVEDGGNIGINTSTPLNTLQIGDAGNTATLRYVDGNQAAGYVLTSDANGVATWQVASGGGSFTGNTSGDCITDIYVTNIYGCSPLHIEPSGVNDVYITENGGNVGIGTATPLTLLTLSNASPELSFNDVTFNDKGSIQFQDGDFEFWTNTTAAGKPSDTGSEVVTIKKDGKVGINTNTPTTRLTVVPNAGTLSWSPNANNTAIHVINADDGDQQGYIDITTGVGAIGGLRFSDTAAEAQGYVYYNHNINEMSLGTNGSPAMTIGSNGAVDFTGGHSVPTRLISGSQTVTIDESEYYVRMAPSLIPAGTIIVNLPASPVDGQTYVFRTLLVPGTARVSGNGKNMRDLGVSTIYTQFDMSANSSATIIFEADQWWLLSQGGTLTFA